MTESNEPARRRRYLIERTSQLSFVARITLVLLGLGVVEGLGFFVLAGGEWGSQTLEGALPLLLGVHAAAILVGGTFLGWVVIKLTHRYVGPAFVMGRALAGIRRGEYGHRLKLRHTDYLEDLAKEIEDLREEIAKRDVQQARSLHRLERSLDEDDTSAIRDSLRALGSALPAMPRRRTKGLREAS